MTSLSGKGIGHREGSKRDEEGVEAGLIYGLGSKPPYNAPKEHGLEDAIGDAGDRHDNADAIRLQAKPSIFDRCGIHQGEESCVGHVDESQKSIVDSDRDEGWCCKLRDFGLGCRSDGVIATYGAIFAA
jgi:hypothetical protein